MSTVRIAGFKLDTGAEVTAVSIYLRGVNLQKKLPGPYEGQQVNP